MKFFPPQLVFSKPYLSFGDSKMELPNMSCEPPKTWEKWTNDQYLLNK